MLVDPVQALATGVDILKKTKTTTTTDHHTHTTHSTTIPTMPHITGGPSKHHQFATDSGERALWVVFVIMLVATIAFVIMSWSVPISKRLYHVITTLIVMIASVAYFAMASGDGISTHTIHTQKHNDYTEPTPEIITRSVYWARYVDWSLTTPLLLLDLCLLAGLNGAHIIMTIAADLFMVIVGLFAAFGDEKGPQKWGYYAIACIAYLVIVWNLVIHGRATANARGGKVGGFYIAIAGFTLLLWTAYPIVWGVADGARIASVDAEIIAYAILDVLAKPIFGLWLLLTHANMPETHLDLGGFWANGLSGEGTIRVGDDDDGA